MRNPFTLEGKTILITGASSGIGRATAVLCSEMGARLIITGRNESELQKTFDALISNNHMQISADLTTGGGGSIVSSCPVLDGLVNNAGVTETLPTDFVTREKLRGVFDINTCAPVILFEELLRAGKIADGASVVFTSSINGNMNYSPGSSLYSASKAAISEYVRQSALRVSARNIRVNAVCPGMTDTNLLRDNNILTPEILAEDAKKYPFKRYARPEEVASGIVYLLSGAASYVTGSELVIDGGVTLSR